MWGVVEMDEGGQEVPTSSYKKSESWAAILYCVFESC